MFITVLPVVTLVKFFNSFDNLTLSAPFADTTPILSSDNLFASAPPLISNCSPNCLLITVVSSPLKFKPFAMVLLMFVTTVGLSISHVRLVNSFTVPAPVILTVPALISPVAPLIVTLSPAVIIPVVPSTTTFLSASEPRVTLSPNPTVYSLPPAALTPSVTVTLASLAFTVVALDVPPIAAFN